MIKRIKFVKTLFTSMLVLSLMGATYINANAASLPETTPALISAPLVQPAYIYTVTASFDLKLGYMVNMPIIFMPENTTNKALTWFSDNPNVAIVNNGIIYSKSLGACRITAITSNGASTTMIVRVVDPNAQELSTALKAVQRAYDYLDLYGANTKNPVLANPAEKRTSLDFPYTDGKRYTDCGGFVSFCYKSTGVYLGDTPSSIPTADELINKVNSNFSRGTLTKAELKPGDIITLKDYYMKDFSHATLVVKNDSTGCFVIDMSPNGIAYRSIDSVTQVTPYNVIRCNK
ncbi:MAG: NlpC/P60 family protein [Oscillospiraceae bacterium]|nr:NlpC/P60 family protein [Oscillospiraceae bacterium]